MGRGFYKKYLATGAQRQKETERKKAVAPSDGSSPSASAMPSESVKLLTYAPEAAVEIFDDVTVCNLLRIKRRTLAAARTRTTRGSDWDAVGLHCGMTRAWIDRYALAHGIVPRYFDCSARPVQADSGVVSVELVGTHPNPMRCTVEIKATGERRYARVRNLYAHPIALREAFDCVVASDGTLEWSHTHNSIVY